MSDVPRVQQAADKTLATLRADPLWIEIGVPNGLIEFQGCHTGDIYRLTTAGNMRFARHSDRRWLSPQ